MATLTALVLAGGVDPAFAVDFYEPDGDMAQAKWIATDGSPQAHEFNPAGDHDWVMFDTRPGFTYDIQTALPEGSSVDTTIATTGAAYTGSDDDSGPGLCSRIIFNSWVSGRQYVEVRDFLPTRTGDYLIIVTETDIQNPTVNDDAPSGWQSSPFNVTITGYDNAAVSSIEYTAATPYGTSWGTVQGSVAVIPITHDGTTTLTFVATDTSGRKSPPRVATVRRDTAPPAASDDAPSSWQTSPVTTTVSAVDMGSGVAAVDWTIAGASTGVGSSSSSPAKIGVTAEGTTTLRYSAIDSSGHRCTTRTATVRIDKSAPRLAITASPSSVSIEASDAVSGVGDVWYTVDGGVPQLYAGGSFSPGGSGDHLITAWCTDLAGNSTAKSAFVTVDTDAPTVECDAPTGWQSGDVTLTLTGSDSLSGIAGIDWALSGASSGSGSAASSPAKVAITTEGTTTIDYSAIDTAGNRCTTETATVRIDKAAPSTTATHAAGWQGSAVTVTLAPTDALSGVASTWYRLGSGGATLYSGPFSVSASGETTVCYWSVDAAGNTEVEQTTVVRIDTIVPHTTDDSVPSYLTGAGGTINLSPTDALSGVAWTRWALNGGAPTAGTRVPVPIAAGNYTLTYCSADTAGNVEPTRTASFSVVAKNVVRLSGDDRYNVSAQVARTGWDPASDGSWPGVKHVIVTCGEAGKEPDALSAAGLSSLYDAPVLLIRSTGIPGSVRTVLLDIASANPGLKVHIVGGTTSVPAARVTDLKAIPGVDPAIDRLGGADRYAVSASIANRMISVAGTDAISGALLYCAEKPGAFYDALAASPIAYSQLMPMLGVKSASVPGAVAPVLASLKAAGKPVYSASSASWIGAPATGAARLTTSANIYTAAADIATTATARGWLANTEPGVAAKLPDALTGGVLLGKRGGVLLYTDSSATLSTVTDGYLASRKAQIVRGWIFGGIVSVQPAVHTRFRNVIQ